MCLFTCACMLQNYFLIPVIRIGFENITFLVQEGVRFAELPVAVIGTTTLGGEVIVRFSTSDISATGHQCHMSCDHYIVHDH